MISQTELSAIVGVDRTTLARQWNRVAMTAGLELTLKRLLDWITLMRAVAGFAFHRPWHEVAAALGVSQTTLSRIAKRCAGVSSLLELKHAPGKVGWLFEKRVLDPIRCIREDS